MLVVSGVIEIADADVDAARAAALDMMEETAKESGCLVYEFSQVLGQRNRFRVYEEWDSAAALEAHMNTTHMAQFRDALSRMKIVSRDIFTLSECRRAAL